MKKAKVKSKMTLIPAGKGSWKPVFANLLPGAVGKNAFVWNGKGTRGAALAPGVYRAVFEARDAAGNNSKPAMVVIKGSK